ncbi:glycosyl transferase [Scytonema sp. UIC 10036]|uniref:glycosyltransferase family protein n=1 Tax=Scytonema sp. UIC 10036 TaxID=2304196 RepID=UPI0012DAB8FB|nr:glycosyltransferase [Scytonema sp. UIC 10036]MUG92071.1 glycosyl transferase [Scytonema sp. UIC 10036]
MKKVMFYCQNLLGMGHLVRTTEIIRSLVKDFKVCLIDGGQIVQGFEIPPAVEVVNLPALRIENGKLNVVDSFQNLETVKELRKNQLLKVFERFQPDCLVTEGYPFSKKKALAFELVPLLEQVQAKGHLTKVVCSLRDIIMVKEYADRAKEEESRCQFMNQYFDMLLVHSDPKVHRLEESFSRANELTCQVHYTGYVVQSPPENFVTTDEDIVSLNRKEPMILVSVGGGRLGHDLLKCILEAAPIFQNYLPHHLQVFTGPFIPEEKFLELQELAADRVNITLRQYTPNLLAYMEKASLSISLGGYNTTMNVLRTRVRSMIYPSDKDNEQVIRTQKLEKLGILEMIRPDDLHPERLVKKINTCLNKERIVDTFDYFELQGAEKTAFLLKELLQSQVASTYSVA